MDESRIPVSPAKTTGIPRFSRLPTSRTVPTSIPPPSSTPAIRSPTKVASFRSSVVQDTPSKPTTLAIPPPSGTGRRSSILPPGFVAPKPPPTQIRRPASPLKSSTTTRPTSRLAQPKSKPTAIARPHQPDNEDANDQLGSLDAFRASSRIGSHDPSPISEYSPSPVLDHATPKQSKSSRLSLSDRTIESLSHLPATPATDRRRSGFFNPESPMIHSPMGPPSRPASALSVHKRLGTSNIALARPTPRPVSPVKRPTTSLQQNKCMSMEPTRPTPGRRSVSASIHRPSLGPTSTSTTNTAHAFSSSVRSSRMPPTSASRTLTRPSTTTTHVTTTKPVRPPTKAPPRLTASATAKPAFTDVALSQLAGAGERHVPTTTSKSSSALRDQIAKAKAAKRSAAVAVRNDKDMISSLGEFDLDTDPFNQRPKDNKGVLRQRIEAARADGRLNIAAMGLSEIPEDVLHMYDADQMQDSKVSWNESVDLSRFIAADNQLTALFDDVFPDIDPGTSAENEEERDFPFAGLELLDFHGNKLQTLPMGLRRLERLTVLNLSHNEFGNGVFDILAQIPELRELKLGHNNVSGYLSQAVGQLAKLEVLDLQANKLLSLPECLRQLTKLRVFNVSGNQLTGLPMDALESLPITELDASRNALVGALFPFSVSGMPSLRELNVSNNSLASLAFSENLSLPALRMLSITNNRIVSLPDLSGWIELTTLGAGDNKIHELPEGFTALKKLRFADLSSNNLTRLDERIAAMDGLESLLVDANPLKDRKFLSMSTENIKRDLRVRMEPTASDERRSEQSFEDEAIDVRSPEEAASPWKMASGTLELSGKNLTDDDTDMLRSFLGVNNVKEMQLARNNFTIIPFELSLAQSLRILDLSACALEGSFLQEPMALPSLLELRLTANKITSLVPLTTHLHAPGLSHLDVSNNRLIGTLPTLRSSFPHLTTLDAADNKLELVNASALRGLRTVSLSRNSIAHLDPEIGLLSFEGLRGLDVGSNVFRVPGHRVLERGTEATLAWLRDRIPGYVGDDETF